MIQKFLSRFQYNSPVVLTYALISVLALLLNQITNGWTNEYLFSIYRTGTFLNPMLLVRLCTYIFGHANYAHFISNFTIILLVGPMLEEKYGSKNLMEMIAFTGILTGLIHIIFFPGVALIGASGIAFMMILLSSYANYEKGKIPLTLILVAIIYLSGEIIDGLFSKDNISQLAHIIGGLCGCLFGWVITSHTKSTSAIE